MKKLLFVLFLSFACTTIYAQVTSYETDIYANGNSYGFSVVPVSGAVSYEWHVQGSGGSNIYYVSGADHLIDVIFFAPGYYDVTCIVTMEDNSQVEHWCGVGVKQEE